MNQELERKHMVSQPPLRSPDLHPNLGSATSDLHADLHPCGKYGRNNASVQEYKSRGWEISRKHVGCETSIIGPKILRGWSDIKDHVMKRSTDLYPEAFDKLHVQFCFLVTCYRISDCSQNFKVTFTPCQLPGKTITEMLSMSLG